MSNGPFCSLCGGGFETYQGAQTPEGRLKWTQEVRAVRTAQHGFTPFLTGLGYTIGISLLASVDSAATYQDANAGHVLEDHNLLHYSREYWAFPFHDFCWQQLLRNVGCYDRVEDVAASLFGVLHGLPRAKSGALVPEHRYYGAIDARWQPGSRRHLYADPTQDLPKDMEKLGVHPLEQKEPAQISQNFCSDAFSLLPTEVIHRLLCSMPSPDVCRFRLACRSISVVSDEGQLPPSFWASRFAPDREMGFVYAHLPVGGARDWKPWRRLYRNCKMALKAHSGWEGFQNRRRIVRCVADVASTLQAMLRRSTAACDGGVHEKPAPALERIILGPQAVCSKLPDLPEAPLVLQFGTRVCKTEALCVSQPEYEGALYYKASLISVDSRTFISGVQICHQDEKNGSSHMLASVGYFQSLDEVSFILQWPGSIARVDVVISASGIEGLVFHIQHAESCAIETLGNTNVQDGSTGIATLQSQGCIVGLLFEFDACKAISVQLMEENAPVASHKAAATATSTYPPSLVWNPSPPFDSENQEFAYAKPLERTKYFSMNLYMPFGGPNGSRLHHLSRVTALLDGNTGFHGLSFSYDDGVEKRYGRRHILGDYGDVRYCVEQSMSINGARGERIARCEVSFTKSTGAQERNICALRIWTSYGHFHEFRSHYTAEDCSTKENSFLLKTAPQYHPIAMIARFESPNGPFESFGIQSQPFSPVAKLALPGCSNVAATASQTAIKRDILAAAHWMLRRGGSCFTKASLTGVKCIRVSTGESGRSRNIHHVSGLWMDYWHHEESSMVGQWVREHEALHLAPDETLTEVTTWSTEEVQFTTPSERFGKILGIRFTTSLGRRAQYLTETTEKVVEMHYCATPYEELRDIVWAFNGQMDDIQIRLQSRSQSVGCQLAFFAEDLACLPLDLSEGTTRSFQRYSGDNYRSKAELAHEATLRYHISRESFFWQELTPSGDIARLAAVSLTFGVDSLIGVEFRYELGISRSFGSDVGDTRIFFINPDQKLSLLMVQVSAGQITGIELHTNHGHTFQYLKVDEPTKDKYLYFALDREASNHPNRTADSRTYHGVPCNDNIGESVGVWFTASRSCVGLRFEAAGPIFRNKEGEIRPM